MSAATSCQRWRDRRAQYRLADAARFDPSIHAVDVLDRAPATRFIVSHHYSGSMTTNRLNVGLFRVRRLVGVAVFGVPSSQSSIPKRTGGLPSSAGVELARLVLLDEIEANAETWMLARAFRLLRLALPEIRAVVSYSDPLPRTTLDGSVVMPGHVGIIYQSLNAIYTGRSKSRTMYLGPGGHEVPPRTLSKLRNGERGDGYAYARLRELGAPPRRHLEDARAYVARALREGPFRALRHPGNHAYVWAFDAADRSTLPRSLPYPKHIV